MRKFLNKKNLIIGSIIVGSTALISPLFYISIKGKNSPADEKNTVQDYISVKYESDPKIKAYTEKENQYQKKITSFDESKYSLPSTNLSSSNDKANCINGFGGEMRPIHQGVFSEPLYNFDAETVNTSNDRVAYAPYVNAYYVVGDILFKKPMDFFDREIITVDQLTRNFTDARTIIGNQAYKSSFLTMESKFGFPQAYLQQQAGLITSLSAFNDNCVKGVGGRSIQFDQIDLSGLPITALFSTKFRTSLYHGINGLYNYTSNTPDFVSQSFVDWIRSNNLIYQQLVNNRSDYVFPKGSFLYVPIKYSVKQEVINVNFKSEPLKYDLSSAKELLAKEQNISPTKITFVSEVFKDFTVFKPVNISTYEPLADFALVRKDDKLYMGTWELPTTTKITGLEPDRSNLVLMNMTALKTSLGVIKEFYQGKKFDVGTTNENLDLRLLKSQKDGLDISDKMATLTGKEEQKSE